VTTGNSLNHSLNSALKHYSSLFFLPSFRRAVVGMAVLCIGVVGFSTFVLFPSLEGFIWSFQLGTSLFVVSLLIDIVVSRTILGKDPIYVPRRTVALSLFGWVLWLFFILVGVVLGALFDVWWWIKLCLLGFAALVTLRNVVFLASSSEALLHRLLASFVQPFLCIGVFAYFWGKLFSDFILRFLPFLAVSAIVASLSAYLFLFTLDRLGKQAYGMPAMPLFRAFMLNWVVGENAPLEKLLEKLGENADIEAALLKFDASVPKAAIIVPLVHPGPFKNIGSSLLPSLIKLEFEKEFGGTSCIPLGLLGHELDLASQEQNHRITREIIDTARFAASEERASPFVKVAIDYATVSCQVFGKTVFLSFTLAPKTTEDLPQELGRLVREQVAKYGFDCALMVNAHNSIDDENEMEVSLGVLQELSSVCLEKVISLPSYPFEVGASTVFPREFSLTDGMGGGGITAIVVRVAEQKTAYVVIDGNNMITGLREEILQELNAAGFHDGEVFTTDTHAVSAVVLGRRGYHPVGEVMDHELLIDYIQEAAKVAAGNLENCKAGCRHLTVPGVRVIGKTRIESLSLLVDKALQRAKQTIVPIFGCEGLGLIILLALM